MEEISNRPGFTNTKPPGPGGVIHFRKPGPGAGPGSLLFRIPGPKPWPGCDYSKYRGWGQAGFDLKFTEAGIGVRSWFMKNSAI